MNGHLFKVPTKLPISCLVVSMSPAFVDGMDITFFVSGNKMDITLHCIVLIQIMTSEYINARSSFRTH